MKRFLLGLTLILVLGLSVTAYLDYRIPRATATVQLHPSILALHPAGVTRSYMENEFEAILAHETLSLAASLLEIEKSHQDKAVQNMKENVTTAPIRGTDFITITAKDLDPQKAIDIANAIAEAYAQRRAKSKKIRAECALQVLDEELATQQKLVTAHRTDLTNLMTQIKIPFPPDGKPFLKSDGIKFEEQVDSIQRSIYRESYDEEVANFSQSRDMLRKMKIAQKEARTLLKNPRPPITIHERATLTPTTR